MVGSLELGDVEASAVDLPPVLGACFCLAFVWKLQFLVLRALRSAMVVSNI